MLDFRFGIADDNHMTFTKTFTCEDKATEFWQTEADAMRKLGHVVISNELVYDEPKKGDFTVVIVTKG